MAALDEIFEWNDEALAELEQIEIALTVNHTHSSTYRPPVPPPTAVQCSVPPGQYSTGFPAPSKNNYDVCYSPPRELSQRPLDSIGRLPLSRNAQELENERLKEELQRVSNQLNTLEQECNELRRDRDRKDKQLTYILTEAEAKIAENISSKEVFGRESQVLVRDQPGVSPKCQNANIIADAANRLISKDCQAVGVQTDYHEGLTRFNAKEELYSDSFLRRKLQSIWSFSSCHISRSFISKLLETCTRDICELFGYLGLNMPARMINSLEQEFSTGIASGISSMSLQSAESAGIPNICLVLMKIRDGMIQVDALLDVLIDLCSTENVLVTYKSLCILRAALDLLSIMGRGHVRRENIKVEGICAEQTAIGFLGHGRQGFGATYGSSRGASSRLSGKKINVSRTFESTEEWDVSNNLFRQVDFGHIFDKMCVISMKSTSKQVQLEAICVMNAILLRSNSYFDREQYGETVVFEAIAQLLRREGGLPLQREAVRLLHLLLNCPKLLAKFCLGWKDLGVDGAMSADFQVSHTILQGLANCTSQCGHVAQVELQRVGISHCLLSTSLEPGVSSATTSLSLKTGVWFVVIQPSSDPAMSGIYRGVNLCRNAMVVLAFLASSGTSGFEIVVFHRLSNGANFLGLILQALASEIDAEASDLFTTPDVVKERTLFMREALILLNRLASNPTSSAAVLQLLTSSRDMVSLSIDIASRLSRQHQRSSSDRAMRQIRQSEVTNLARVFKKRIFSFLGETVSF